MSHPAFGIPSDRFVIERELGRGGMSTVFLAHDQKHDRRVAVKLLSTEAHEATDAERFAQEIRVTAQLQHPHILPLLDSEQSDGHTYYVMPYVEGESLRDRMIRERTLAASDALLIAREVADALAYAHGRGVVHRDIKPENILLSAGHAIVADFGIARAPSVRLETNPRLTQPGLAVGTPAYMSPEQMLDESVDGRTDLYALGCLLFEMLLGALPYEGATAMATLAHKLSGAAPSIPSSASTVPEAITTLMLALLSRDPAHRPQRAEDVMAIIDEVRLGTSPPAVPIEAHQDSIAVLAFASMSPDPADAYLAEGISESLTSELSRVAGLRVIARTSAFAFKGTSHDVRDIGARLRVRRLVDGSVRRAGDRLRVTAKLVDAPSGVEIWSQRFDGTSNDVFTIEDDLAHAVTTQLKTLLREEGGARLATRVASAPPTSSVAAYEQYLKGRYWWGMRTEASMQRSLEHLEQALALDSQFAKAAAAKAETLATLGLYGLASPLDVMPLARTAAEHSLSLDPSSAEALCARGCVRAAYECDWEGALRDFTAAIAADPQYPTSYQWMASTVLVPLGRFDEAHRALETARALDPLSRSIAVSRAAAHYYERNVTAAIADSREALQLDERFAMGHFFLGLALALDGDASTAQLALEQATSLSPSAETLAALGHLHAASGEREQARAYQQRLTSEATHRYQSPVLAAQIAAGLGESDEAMRLLRLARDLRAADLIWVGVRPAFDSLRSIPAFAELCALLGVPVGHARPQAISAGR